MKVLVVLVFAFFTGCNADLHGRKPKSKLDLLNKEFWDYVSKTMWTTQAGYDDFRQTEFGAVVNKYLIEGLKAVDMHVPRVWEHLPSSARESINMGLYDVSVYTEETLIAVKKKLDAFVEEAAPVAEKIASRLIQCADELRDMASPHIGNLKENLQPLAQSAQAQLTQLYNRFSKPAKSTTI